MRVMLASPFRHKTTTNTLPSKARYGGGLSWLLGSGPVVARQPVGRPQTKHTKRRNNAPEIVHLMPHRMRLPVLSGLALCAAYFLGLVGFWGATLLCGVGFVLSNRRNTSSSRF